MKKLLVLLSILFVSMNADFTFVSPVTAYLRYKVYYDQGETECIKKQLADSVKDQLTVIIDHKGGFFLKQHNGEYVRVNLYAQYAAKDAKTPEREAYNNTCTELFLNMNPFTE